MYLNSKPGPRPAYVFPLCLDCGRECVMSCKGACDDTCYTGCDSCSSLCQVCSYGGGHT